MNAEMVILTYKVWRLLNRKHLVTKARMEKAVGKVPILQAVKAVEDAYGVHVTKDEHGYHMDETAAKAPTSRKPKAKKATKPAAKKKSAA